MKLRLCQLAVALVGFCLAGFLVSPARAQTSEPSEPEPPASQPARPITPAEVLAGVEQRLTMARTANRNRREAQAKQLLADAQRGVDTVLRVEPKNTLARVLQAELTAESGEQNKARELFKAVLAEDKNNFRANLGMGQFYISSRWFRQARDYLIRAEQVAPADRRAEVLRLLAYCHSNEGQRAEALATAERAVAADPKGFESLQMLVQARLQAEQFEKAVESARAAVAVCRQAWQDAPGDGDALGRLITANDMLLAALRARFRAFCRQDAKGQYTDQLQPGSAGKVASVMSQIAYAAEDIAKLRWEYAYYDTLAQLEQMVELQTDDAIRDALLNNTSYLLDKARLQAVTHQTDKAIETYQRLLDVARPTDEVFAEVAKNKEAARRALEQLNAAPATQPAREPAAP